MLVIFRSIMNSISEELYKLYHLTGADFIAKLKAVTTRSEFHPSIFRIQSRSSGGVDIEGEQDVVSVAPFC